MGSYSELRIGDIVFAWKYRVPPFLTFVFREDDLFIERETLSDGQQSVEAGLDEPYIVHGGYRTNVAAARSVLDEYGYTVPFFAEIYQSFRKDLDWQVRERLEDELARIHEPALSDTELTARIDAHVRTSPNTAVDDLESFTAFLREAIETDLKMAPFLEEVEYDTGPGQPPRVVPVAEHTRYQVKDLADFDSLQMLIFDRATKVPASVLRPMALFDESYIYDYPEVISLLYLRLVLDATTDDAIVELDVAQVVETEAEIRSMHLDLAYELLQKVDVYERVFRALSDREEDVQDRYARTQVHNALVDLASATGAQAKGEALEALMAAAFSIRPQLQVAERRYSTEDEEIDLLVKNNVNRPFWTALGSPLFIVECKNWSKPVGALEVRDLEGKLLNHKPLARIGVLVAPGGFTSEATTAVKRASRDDVTLALVDRDDLDDLALGSSSVLDWLEKILCRPI